MLNRYQPAVAFAFGCTLVSLFASAVQAQQLYPQRPNQPQVITYPVFHNKIGEYAGMQGSYMKCILDGTQVMVQFQKTSKVKVTGMATADALAPGMFVQFQGTFNRFGKGMDPIKDVVIYAPDATTQPGAYAAGGSVLDEPTSSKKKGPVPATSTYQISGKITSAHKNTIHVDCGNMKVKADIAPDATVKLDTSDLSWASPGDKINITGAILGPARALCVEATIELAAPIAGKKKSHPAHVAEKTADKTVDKAADKVAKPADKTEKDARQIRQGDRKRRRQVG